MTKKTSKKVAKRAPAKRKAKGQSTPAMLGGIAFIGTIGAAIGAGIYKLATLN